MENNNEPQLIQQRDQSQAIRDAVPVDLATYEAAVDPITDALDAMADRIAAAKLLARPEWDVYNHLDRADELIAEACDRMTEATIYAQLVEGVETDEDLTEDQRARIIASRDSLRVK